MRGNHFWGKSLYEPNWLSGRIGLEIADVSFDPYISKIVPKVQKTKKCSILQKI